MADRNRKKLLDLHQISYSGFFRFVTNDPKNPLYTNFKKFVCKEKCMLQKIKKRSDDFLQKLFFYGL